jgi:phage terminase Nu1 subunit (DNA packaging protein)
VQVKAAKLGISIRLSEGYNISDLAEVFGLHRSRIESWARRGLLGKHTGHGGHGGNIRFAETNVVRFIRRHPSEYDLGRVDATWFKSMVFGRYAGRL